MSDNTDDDDFVYRADKDPDWLNDRDREWEIETGASWPVIGEAK